MNLQNSLQK